MGDSVTVKVTGLENVVQKMREVGPKISRGLIRQALKDVGEMWVERAQAEAPEDDGDLIDSIKAKVTTRAENKDGAANIPVGAVEVGPTMTRRSDGKDSVGPGIYGMWVEFGLKHKKYPKNPFMRRTYDATAEKAVDLFAETLANGLDEALQGD